MVDHKRLRQCTFKDELGAMSRVIWHVPEGVQKWVTYVVDVQNRMGGILAGVDDTDAIVLEDKVWDRLKIYQKDLASRRWVVRSEMKRVSETRQSRCLVRSVNDEDYLHRRRCGWLETG